MDQPKKQNGMWLKTDKNGLKYMSGSLEIDGVAYWLNIFKNTFKEEGDKKPDYTYTLSPKEQRRDPQQPDSGDISF